MFGINRARAKAHSLAKRSFWRWSIPQERGEVVSKENRTALPAFDAGLDRELLNVSDAVNNEALRTDNKVTFLLNGEQAYPAMLQAIERSESTVFLITFILRSDSVGKLFISALQRAAARGVDVRVIIDGVGDYYCWPRASRMLKKAGLNVVRYYPPTFFPPSLLINLRNHKKLLVCDGDTAFTGGINIGENHCVEKEPIGSAVTDVHFQLGGPIVADLSRQFCDIWYRVTESVLQPTPANEQVSGEASCRMLVAGPDEHMDRLELIFNGAISAARESIDIMTPYFLPSREMIAVLKTAALKGVKVRVILPAASNLRYVDWATRNMLWELLLWGVEVYYQRSPPFSHTKLFVVDQRYSIVGSANMDPRSLRLNFELCIEIFDTTVARTISQHCDTAIVHSSVVSLESLDRRSIISRLRDALFWLFSPYL